MEREGTAEQERREVRASDGRRVVFNVAGPADGDLLFFNIGTPGSALMYEGMVEACVARGLRVACIARPGYGGSDRRLERTIADSAEDTAAVADALGAELLYVIGHSSGGAYTLADAGLLKGRVRAAACSASIAPRASRGDDWMSGSVEMNDREFAALAKGDAALQQCLEEELANYRLIDSKRQLLASFHDFTSEADRACLRGRYLDYQLKGCQLVAEDGVWGWFDDDKAAWNEWGIDLGEVDVPLSIWHGEEDKIVPIAEGECLARLLPSAQPYFLPYEGHFSLFACCFPDILDDLLACGG